MNQNETQLDALELALLKDAEVLPRKHSVQRKLERLLAETGQKLSTQKLDLPWPSMHPKLSRGENYEQQAYRVMDYPRVQEGESFLFYRTLILWGHPIGLHLIASGHFMERLAPALLSNYRSLDASWQYVAHDNPWLWESDKPGLMPCSGMKTESLEEEINKRKFLKLSRFLPLKQYVDLTEISVNCFAELHHYLFSKL